MRPMIIALLAAAVVTSAALLTHADDLPTEAPAGFTMVTNGHASQEQFDAARIQFEQAAQIIGSGQGESEKEGGLGPTYNADSCLACHSNPTTGGDSQIAEIRCGKVRFGMFVAPPGGTLVRQRAIDPAAQQSIPEEFDIRTRRMSTSLFGLGFVEFIRDADLLAVQASQPPELRGTANTVTVTTGVAAGKSKTKFLRPLMDHNTGILRGDDGGFTTATRIGRFGWKCQHGSLLDFSADANLNEKGITSPLQPFEALALDGRSLSQFDRVADPEDEATPDSPFGADISSYTRFMRSLRVPPRDFSAQNTPDVRAGEAAFTAIGCAVCHTPTFITAPGGAIIAGVPGGVPAALGNKIIRPYSDFLLHNIETGDGIIQGGGPETRNMVRTAFLWGVRTKPELMHDGLSYTFEDSIQRHGGQASGVRDRYRALSADDKRQLKAFLKSL